MTRPAATPVAATRAALLLVSLSACASAAIAQEPPGRIPAAYFAPSPLPAPPASARALPAPSPSRLISSGNALKLAQNEGEPKPGLTTATRKSVAIDSAESDRRVERLKKQLDQLREQLAKPPVEPPVLEKTIVDPLPEPPAKPPVSTAPPATLPPPPVIAPPKAIEPAIVEPAPSNGHLKASGLIKGLPVAAIDRIHVADNLFAAGEPLLALEIYAQVDRKAVSDDEAGWVEFQMANCSRRLGKYEDARKRYRRVVSDPTLGWLQDMARWRLEAIDERESLLKEYARLDGAIKQLAEAKRVQP